MILTGPEIVHQYKQNRLLIEPFDEQLLNPNSYNYRLGETILEFEQAVLDPKMPVEPKVCRLGVEGILLQPGHLYLGHTEEIIGSDYFASQLIGRSSLGRLGLWLEVTADLGHVGTAQRWTLEMKVVQPLRVYAGMRIGQVSFWRVLGSRSMKYNGRYAHDLWVEASRIGQDFV